MCSSDLQEVTCFECNGHGHFKRECPNYLRSNDKAYATTLSDSDSSNSDSKENCDGEGNYSVFMTIARVESSEDLSKLVEELREHSDEESMGTIEELDAEEDKIHRVFKRTTIHYLRSWESMQGWPRQL